MSGIKALKIGDLVLQRPVIQGGMGVGISLHKLAGAVAASGGMGLISTAQIGFREPDFKTNFVEAKSARYQTGDAESQRDCTEGCYRF